MTAARPLWLKLLIAAALAVGLFNIGAYVYGLTLPNEWHVERSVVIGAPPGEVYPLLASPKRWQEWTEWNGRNDPSAKFTTDGPESGEGASLTWIGREIGTGRIAIRKAEPDRAVTYELFLNGSEFTKDGRLTLEPTDGGTRVTWADGGEIGNTVGRLFREHLERGLAAKFDANLAALKDVAERKDEPRTTSSEADAPGRKQGANAE